MSPVSPSLVFSFCQKEENRLTNECKVALQQLPVRVKPGVSEPTVLVLADDVVHDVSQEAGNHEDLHVVTFPTVL